MKNLVRKRLLMAIAAGAALAVSGVTQAAQTQAGTNVSNSATLSYVDLGLLDAQTIADLLADPAGTITGITDNLQATVDAPAEFVVDERLDVDITYDGGNVNVTPGGPTAGAFYVAPFTVTNEGNSPIDVVIDPAQLATGQERPLTDDADTFDMVNEQILIYLDDGVASPGVFSAADDTLIYDSGAPLQLSIPLGVTPTAATALLDAQTQVTGDSAQLFIVVEGPAAVPAGTEPNAVALVELTATAVDINAAGFDTATITNATNAREVEDTANTADTGDFETAVQTVFADGKDPDTATDDAPEAQDRATAEFIVQAADFVFTKTDRIICDPINGYADPTGTIGPTETDADSDQTAAFHIPGAVVRYSITIANNGNAGALLTAMTDQLQGDISYEPNLIDREVADGDNDADTDPVNTLGEDTCDSAVDDSIAANVGTGDPGNAARNGIRVIRTGGNRGNAIAYYAPISLATVPPQPPNGAFAIITPALTGTTQPDGGGGQLLTFSFPTALTSADGPLPGNAASATPPGQLDAGETIVIEFNARIR